MMIPARCSIYFNSSFCCFSQYQTLISYNTIEEEYYRMKDVIKEMEESLQEYETEYMSIDIANERISMMVREHIEPLRNQVSRN